MHSFINAALLAVAANALQLSKDRAFPENEEALLALARHEGVLNADDQFKHIIGSENASHHGKPQLAETGQYVYTCGETFRRFDTAVQANVGSVITAGVAWSDPLYTQGAAMYGINGLYTWKRMSAQFPESSGYTLFQGNLMSSINIDDALQGYLGDCWIFSSLASVAEKPERIWRMFDTKTYNAAGIYSIRFYELGVPISVVIDDYLPFSGSWNIAGKPNEAQKETWPILIEKAFSKLHGNYKSSEIGWMIDAGNSFLGTGGSSISTSKLTAEQIWASALDWDTRGYVMTAGTTFPLDGIIGNHAYSFIACYTLNNGAKVFKLRNPWGRSEWTGAYADSDVFWTNNPDEAVRVGWLEKNDGDFFITVEDFKSHFASLAYNYDPTNWNLSYWLARGDGDTVGVAGTTSYCGALCKRSTFTIYSAVSQNIYVSVYLHKRRQYVEAPCTDAAISTSTPIKRHYTSMPNSTYIWSQGSLYHKPYAIAAGKTITVYTELDWTRSNIEKSFSVQVWADQQAVTLNEKSGKASTSWHLYNPVP